MTVNLGEDLFNLGETLGLSQAETTEAIRILGADILGPKLDAVINSQQSGARDEQFRRSVDAISKINVDDQRKAELIKGSADFLGLDSADVGRALDTSQTNVLNIADQFGLPKFADGAYVDKPTLAVVGEAGPEFIVPVGGNRISRTSNAGSAGLQTGSNKSYDDMIAELRNMGKQNAQMIAYLESIAGSNIQISTDIAAAKRNRPQARTVRA